MVIIMYARIKNDGNIYKSFIYGLINFESNEQAIVINPILERFEIIDYVKNNDYLHPCYEIINNSQEEWVRIEKVYLLKLKKYLNEISLKVKIDLFRGYSDVFNDFSFLAELLSKGFVSLDNASISIRNHSDFKEWTYIKTQEDANDFMELFAGFHDSTLDSLNYEEDEGKRNLTIRFDNTGWFGVVEICFEGLIALNLRPYHENCPRTISAASLIVKDESIYWADDFMREEKLNYDGTFVKSLNMKWKKLAKIN